MSQEVIVDLPQNAKVSVTVGTPLGLTSKLYTISDTEDLILPITTELKAKPEDIFQLVNLVIGDLVKKGDVLAQKKGVFGMKKVISPESGKLTAINHVTGEITISVEKSETKSLLAPVEGTVTNIDTTRGAIVISVPSGEEFSVEIISDQAAGGEISYVDVSYITSDLSSVKDKIVVIEEISPAAASKFEVLDAVAFIYLTGSHSSPTPHAKIKNKQDFEKLKGSKKKKAVLLPKQKKIITYS